MGQLKELQVFANSCGDQEIIELLASESIVSDTRRAYGKYIFHPTEVLTHRSVLAYRVKKILEKNGIVWSGDPMDVGVTRILMQVRENVAKQSTDAKRDLPVSLRDLSP